MGITIINICLYLFQAAVFYLYCNNVFESKYKKIVRFLCTFAGFSALFFINLIGNSIINDVAIIVVSFLIMFLVYNASVLNSFLQSILYLALTIGCEYLVIPIINLMNSYSYFSIDFRNDFHGYLFGAIFSKSIQFMALIIMMMFFSKNKQNRLSKKGSLLILAIPLSNNAFLLMIESISQKIPYSKEMNIIWIVISILMLLLTFLVFANRSYIINQAEKLNELNIENQKRELDEQYLSLLEKSNDNMQILAHDFKNHLSFVRNLDNVEDIDAYIDKIYPEIEKFQQTASTGNKTLDAILGKYTSISQMHDIKFTADVKNANLSQVESVDLISLLNNLLDNAVESAEQSQTKTISLALIKDTQFMDKLTVKNACDKEPAQSGDKLLTRKKEGALHGTGLKSVKKVCEQYGANYAWDYDNENRIFTTTVLIPKDQ